MRLLHIHSSYGCRGHQLLNQRVYTLPILQPGMELCRSIMAAQQVAKWWMTTSLAWWTQLYSRGTPGWIVAACSLSAVSPAERIDESTLIGSRSCIAAVRSIRAHRYSKGRLSSSRWSCMVDAVATRTALWRGATNKSGWVHAPAACSRSTRICSMVPVTSVVPRCCVKPCMITRATA